MPIIINYDSCNLMIWATAAKANRITAERDYKAKLEIL